LQRGAFPLGRSIRSNRKTTDFAHRVHAFILPSWLDLVRQCAVRRAETAAMLAESIHAIHRNADRALTFVQGTTGGFLMSSKPSEAVIERLVASCDGDVHGALRALLLVNEQLEAELEQLYAAVAVGGPFERGSNVLH